MPHIAHTYPPEKLKSGATVTVVLADGVGCHWVNKGHEGHEDRQCVPVKGGACDRKEWTDDGCRVELSIFGKRHDFTVVYKCMCQNSIEDASA